MPGAGGVASLGVLFVVGMGLYGRMYVALERFEQRTNKLHVATVGFFSTRERLVDVSEVLGSTYHHGRMRRASVNAPWTTLRMAGQRLPLLVDGRGKVMNPDLAWKLLGVENVVSTGFS